MTAYELWSLVSDQLIWVGGGMGAPRPMAVLTTSIKAGLEILGIDKEEWPEQAARVKTISIAYIKVFNQKQNA